MAGFDFLRGLGSAGAVGSGFFQGQDERLRRQMMENQLFQSQQQQQGLAALANAYGTMNAPQVQPPPQVAPAPNPGQPSQPAGQPQGVPPGMGPPPGGPPQGMPPPQGLGPQRGPIGMPPPQGQPPMGQGMPQGGVPRPPVNAAPPPIPPYTAPQAPQVPGPQAGGAPGMPPQGDPVTQAVQSTLPSLQDMAKTLRSQGLSGMALFAALSQHSQFLNMDGKRELAQIAQQVRLLQAQAAGVRAGAAQENADTNRQKAGTGAAAEARREATAEGTNALGAATIGEKQARAQHLHQMGAQASAGKPGKPQVFTDADGKMYSSVLLPDGQIVVRDAQGRQLAEEDVPQRVTPGQATMIHTVQLDEREIDMSLDLMRKAGPEATASAFFDTSKDKGALTRWTENSLTSEEYQKYDVAANRIATAVAGIQSMGRGQVSDEKIRQARKLVPAPGDKTGTINRKLDYIQGIRDWADAIIRGKKKLVTPTAADRAWAKAHPEDALAFVKQFGEAP